MGSGQKCQLLPSQRQATEIGRREPVKLKKPARILSRGAVRFEWGALIYYGNMHVTTPFDRPSTGGRRRPPSWFYLAIRWPI